MIEADRLITASPREREEQQDRAIRPLRLADYIGQPVVREQMALFIQAARGRAEALDHTLIFGPPGLGKTTLANIIAEEMGSSIKSTSGPVSYTHLDVYKRQHSLPLVVSPTSASVPRT